MTKTALKPPLHAVRELVLKQCTGDARAGASSIWDNALQEMCLLMWPPFSAPTEQELTDRYALALRAYIEDLGEYPAAIIIRAWKILRRRTLARRWPTIADFRGACAEATAEQKMMSLDAPNLPFWKKHLRTRLEPLNFSSWIAPLELLRIERDDAVFQAPNSFVGDWARRHYESQLLDSVRLQHPSVTRIIMRAVSAAEKTAALEAVQ